MSPLPNSVLLLCVLLYVKVERYLTKLTYSMAKKINITPYKLTKVHKAALTEHLLGKVSLLQTAKRMGLDPQRVYTMLAVILKHSCTNGRIDIQELLKDY